MPSRCAFESRPFLELPKPFLCAMSYPACLRDNVANADFGVRLPMSLCALVLLFPLELEYQNLLRAILSGNGCVHADCARVFAGDEIAAVVEKRHHFAERDFRSDFGG